MAADTNLVPSQETNDYTKSLVQVVIWTKPTKGLKQESAAGCIQSVCA